MKKTAAVSKRCPHCKIVRRRKRSSKKGGGAKWVTYVYCSSNPRHKQKQG